MKKYRYTADELLHSTNRPPASLDYLEFEYQGVSFRCFGILHGITGGLNRDYCTFIEKSIRETEGLKLAEKGMKQLYRNCGIDEEMEDWLVLRKIDCLIMGFQLLADPRCLWMITIDALRERLRKHDPFIVNGRQSISDLGESPYFHYLEEYQRRDLMGFLPSQQAIASDLNSMTRWYKAIFPKTRHIKIDHPQWHRILLLERLMHIPCRSIHMLHYALAYARQHNHSLVNIFVGETHNTDMHYLAQHLDDLSHSLNEAQNKVMQKIITRADKFGKRKRLSEKLQLFSKKLGYIIFLLVGTSLPLSIYFMAYLK
ncbi:hypothetical protein ACFL3P_00940 [Pseudomonadota bacterium]